MIFTVSATFRTELVLVLFLLLFTFRPLRAQGSDAVDGLWVFNYQSTDLDLVPLGKTAYRLENRSRSRIVAYLLGCVSVSNGRPAIVARLPRRQADIAPSDAALTLGTHALSEKNQCLAKKSKLATLSIDFEDGATWNAPGMSNDNVPAK